MKKIRNITVFGIILFTLICICIPVESIGQYQTFSFRENIFSDIKSINVNADNDTTPPVTTYSLNGTLGNNNIYISNVEMTLNATDDQSGVYVTYYHNNPDPVLEYIQPFIVSGQGTHAVSFYSVDNAGNQEKWHHVQISIDLYPPHIEIVGGWDKDQECWWIETDVLDNCSGIDRVEFYIEDELKFIDEKPPFKWTYDYPDTHLVSATAYDIAGLNASDEFFQDYSVNTKIMFSMLNFIPENIIYKSLKTNFIYNK